MEVYPKYYFNISQHSKIINEIFYKSSYTVFEIWYIFYTYSIGQSRLTTFRVLISE